MRRLILMRHARAERGSPTGEDFDRPLSVRGEAEAALMGQALARSGLAPDRALVSSAARTRQTWMGVAQSFPGLEARFDRAFYLADPAEILGAVEAEDDADTLIVVAHNPGIHALALRLLDHGSAPPSVRARLQGGFPPATAAVFEIDAAGRPHYDGLFMAAEQDGGAGQ